jgi:hypothetical protein
MPPARERIGVDWDPAFGRRHPGIDTLRPSEGWPIWPLWPELTQLQSLLDGARPRVANGSGRLLRLERLEGASSAADFERRVAVDGVLRVRHPSWHDLFNVLAWSAWPQAKAALNARHVSGIEREAGGNRSPSRDALTGFDEDGVIIAVTDERFERLVRGFRWKELFWEQRAILPDVFHAFVFGHALAEKLLAPFVGITGKAVCFLVEPGFSRLELAVQRRQLDGRLAERLKSGDQFASPRELMPLPVLGLPGWWHHGDAADFYDDSTYFRPGRMRAR